MHNKQKKYFTFRSNKTLYYILIHDKEISAITTEMPRSVEIFPTLRCNLGCKLCDRGREVSILKDFGDIKSFFDNLKKDPSFHLLDFKISGGEPTLYPKINELVMFLHMLDPHANIDFLTNAMRLKKLTKRSLAIINICPSIYPWTRKILQKNEYALRLLGSSGARLKVNVFFHEDMESYGTLLKNKFDPFSFCFIPTLLCGTKRVYPCCRAHRLEQMYKKRYHLHIYTPGLYGKLKSIIKNTDLCSHCPHMYRDGKKYFFNVHEKNK